MATRNRPVRPTEELNGENPKVVAFYESVRSDDHLAAVLGPVIRGKVKAAAIPPRLRQVAKAVLDNEAAFSPDARSWAVWALRKVGLGGTGGRAVSTEGGRKQITVTAYPESKEQQDWFKAVAKSEGLSLSAWMLTVLIQAAEASGIEPKNP